MLINSISSGAKWPIVVSFNAAIMAFVFAAAVGVSTMPVYTLFGDKQGLLGAMHREGFRRLGAELRAVPRSVLLAYTNHYEPGRRNTDVRREGCVVVEDHAFIGAHVVVMPETRSLPET